MPSFDARLVGAFTAALKSNPVVVNSITGFTLCSGSDYAAQCLERWREQDESRRIDRRRLLSSGLIGGSFGGFIYPNAYRVLDSIWPGKALASILQKAVVEIMTVGLFVNSVSISVRGMLAGRDQCDVAKHVVREMPMVTLNDARVWLPYNVLAFACIPAYLRPTTTALMEASWQTYISLRSHAYSLPKPSLQLKSQPAI